MTPMMSARLLHREDAARHGRLFRLSERGFQAVLRGYDRGLRFVFRHRSIRGPSQGPSSGCAAEGVAMPTTAVAGRPCLRHPGRRRNAERPTMPIYGYVTVCVVIVAGSESCRHRMGVWCYVQVLHRRIAFYPAVHAIASQGRISIRSRQIAKNVVEGTVLANDEEHMLQMRQWTAFHACRRIVPDNIA